MTYDQAINLISSIVPLIVFLLGMLFKLNQDKREELAHALDYALSRLRDGKIDAARAKEIVLATGAVSEKKVNEIMDKMKEANRNSIHEGVIIHKNEVIPGVALTIDHKGNFAVNPSGLANKAAHKLTKWLKKKF